MSKNENDIRVNFMLDKSKHKDLMILSRISGKTVTGILTDYISKIISENRNAIEERKEIEARQNDSLRF